MGRGQGQESVWSQGGDTETEARATLMGNRHSYAVTLNLRWSPEE